MKNRILQKALKKTLAEAREIKPDVEQVGYMATYGNACRSVTGEPDEHSFTYYATLPFPKYNVMAGTLTELLDKLEAHTCPECQSTNEKAGSCTPCQRKGE